MLGIFVKWGMGIVKALFPSKKKKEPSLIFDTVCPNHFLLCNLKRNPSVKLPVCLMSTQMQDIVT